MSGEEQETGVRKKLRWWRRQWLVEEHFQLHFIAFTTATAIAACLVFYGAASYFFSKYTSFAIEVGLRPSDPFFTVLRNMETMLTYMFAVTAFAVIVFTCVAGLVFSNRVAGPMYRLRMHMEKVARGETLDAVSFREKDYFHDIAATYNYQLEYLRGKIEAQPQGQTQAAFAEPTEIKKAG
jgi:hypothetical protein